MMWRFRTPHRLVAMTTLLLLGGCASITQGNGFSAVQDLTQPALKKELRWIKSESDAEKVNAEIKKTLSEPLGVEGAVQIALLNNRGLQASYNGLGISAAQMVSAITPPNPGFSFTRMKGERLELERAITIDILGLLTLPIKALVEDRRWEQAKLQTANQVFKIAAETRTAYYDAVAAEQLLAYTEQIKLAAEASAEMARRLGQTGAYSRMQQAREHAFYSDIMGKVVRARQSAASKRERLIRLLGLWGERTAFKLPQKLPDLPKSLSEQGDIEAKAITQRLDIRIAKLEVEGLARSYGLTQATRFINVLEGGVQDRREKGEPRAKGYEIQISVPIFDFGTTAVAHAENTYLQAVNHLQETAVNARSEVRESYENWRLNYDLAQHYQQNIVPTRSLIAEEQLLHYNGMLVGVFELLADAREQITSVMEAIEAQRDFWISDAELQVAMLSGNGFSMKKEAAE